MTDFVSIADSTMPWLLYPTTTSTTSAGGSSPTTPLTIFPGPVSQHSSAVNSYWLSSNLPAHIAPMSIWTSSYWPTLNLLERDAAVQIIQSMGSLTENWDGYGGVPIPLETSRVASSLVSSLSPNIPTPEVSANANGTISLEWENDLGRAHLEIGKTKYSLYFRRTEGSTVYRDGLVNEIDKSRQNLLSAMYPVSSPQDYTINLVRLAQAA